MSEIFEILKLGDKELHNANNKKTAILTVLMVKKIIDQL